MHHVSAWTDRRLQSFHIVLAAMQQRQHHAWEWQWTVLLLCMAKEPDRQINRDRQAGRQAGGQADR